MIIVAIIVACIAAVVVILELLPVWSPIDLTGAIADLSGTALFDGLGWLNGYLPVDTLITILALQATIWSAVYVVRFVVWILQLFHIAGGGGS